MALPSSSVRCREATNEPIDALVSKLPDALQIEEQTVKDGFREYSIEISSSEAEAERPPDFPKLPDTLEVEDVMTEGYVERSVDEPAFAASNNRSGNLLPIDDANTGLLEVECRTADNNSAFPADLNDLSHGSEHYRVVEVQEKTRKFPVLLSGEECSCYSSATSQPSSFSSRGSLGQLHENGSVSLRGSEAGKDSASEGDGEDEDFKSASSLHETNLLSPSDNLNGLATEEPLQGILESTIAQLEVATTASSKAEEEESKTARARKRQMKEVRSLLDGTERRTEEKLRLLNSKYLQQVAENRQMEKEYMALNRKCKQANREKETLHGELTKNTALRQKLESLCRELQRQNKMLVEDSKRISFEEDQRRLDLSTQFHDTIKDITVKLEAKGEERLHQLEENDLMREKLKHFTEQFDIREQHFAHQLQTRSLEQQLLEVKLKQQEDLALQAEVKNRMFTDQIAHLLKTEQDLRAQLALYGEKFKQFQGTLTKSNEVFATFKTELEKTTKISKKLEKENSSLKKKCEKSDVSIVELFEERDMLKKQLATTKSQKDKLEALCRSLQAERKLQAVSSDSGTSLLPSQLEHETLISS